MTTPLLKTSHILYLLRLVCRYYIAYKMFSYAFGKILKTQFDLGLYTVDNNISDFDGFALTWHYYGFSRYYGLVIAFTQIAAGMLLLFRKTERLGVVLLLSFMVNIVFVDYFYGIDGAKTMAVTLTSMGMFLLFSDWKGFKTYFLRAFDKVQWIPELLPEKFKLLYWLKFLIIPVMIYFAYNYINGLKKNHMSKHELFGVWQNVSYQKPNGYYKLYFDYFDQIRIRDFSKNSYYGQVELDTAQNKFTFSARHSSEEARFFVSDSLSQLEVHKDSVKSIRTKIYDHYNTVNNTRPLKDISMFYELKGDTLILNNDTSKLKFVNITSKYKN